MPDQCSLFHDRPPLRVVIIDDMPEVRRELSLLLELTGEIQIVGGAANGEQALDQVQALRPDVVLMDLEMPVMNGYAATRRIKAQYPSCRVIALTIHGGDGERAQALEAGMVEVVVKGAPLETLMQAIRGTAKVERQASGDSV